MGRLIKAEFLKLSKSLGYKVLLLSAAGMGVLIGFLMLDTMWDTNGSRAYLSILEESQVYAVFASVFAGVFICGEFSNRTFGVSVFGGCPRLSILLAKAAVFVVGLLSISFTYPLISAAITTTRKGFGILNAELLSRLGWATFLFIFGVAAMGSFCFMLAMLIKNIGGTIGACLGTLIGIATIAEVQKFQPVMKYTFLYQIAQVTQPESLTLYYAVISSTIMLALIASRIIFERAELK